MPGSPTTPGRAGTRDDAPVYVAFREYDHVGSRIVSSFRGSVAGLCAPLPTLRLHPHGADARLGAGVDRFFTVMDLHHLLLAGLTGAP
jgi:hypothetical protein